MPEEDPTLQFELNEEAIGLMLVGELLSRALAWRADPRARRLDQAQISFCCSLLATTSIAQAAN